MQDFSSKRPHTESLGLLLKQHEVRQVYTAELSDFVVFVNYYQRYELIEDDISGAITRFVKKKNYTRFL
jgi:hypothetical protein